MPRILNWTKPDISGYKGMGFAHVSNGQIVGDENSVTDLSFYEQLIGGQPTQFANAAGNVPTIRGSTNLVEWVKKNWLWLVVGGVGGMVLLQKSRR